MSDKSAPMDTDDASSEQDSLKNAELRVQIIRKLVQFKVDDPTSEKSHFEEIKADFNQLESPEIDWDHLQWSRNDRSTILGVGASAVVYRCECEGTQYALKYFDVGNITDKEMKLLRREVRIMKLVQHKNLIGFAGFKLNDYDAMIVCELALMPLHRALHTSANHIRECMDGATYALPHKIRWLLNIAEALQYLHYCNIIHRDIKPLNVMVQRDSNGVIYCKVADFGLSLAVGLMSTRGSKTDKVGSIAYMAPEIIDFEDFPVYSPAVDIYAFGILANEILSQEMPFADMAGRAIERAVLRSERPRLHTPNFPQEVAIMSIIGNATSGCLAKDASVRPTADDIVAALSRF